MPEYYKTNKGYCYKKTRKGASRISVKDYEKAMMKKGGVGNIIHTGVFGTTKDSELNHILINPGYLKKVSNDTIKKVVDEFFYFEIMQSDDDLDNIFSIKPYRQKSEVRELSSIRKKNSNVPRLPQNISLKISNMANNYYPISKRWRELVNNLGNNHKRSKIIKKLAKIKTSENLINFLNDPDYSEYSKIWKEDYLIEWYNPFQEEYIIDEIKNNEKYKIGDTFYYYNRKKTTNLFGYGEVVDKNDKIIYLYY
tara:strand:- start:1742 stop:2500 length:759 start_codon:yes stop_codon:yes gene_type:complete